MPSPTRTRSILITLWLLVAIATITCIVLPIIGAGAFFSKFSLRYSVGVHLRLLAPQLIGPVFTLLASLALLLTVIFRKHLPWWLWLIPLLGPPFTVHVVRESGVSHDFSHTVFNECSSIYGTWITSASTIAGAALLTSAVTRLLLWPLKSVEERRW